MLWRTELDASQWPRTCYEVWKNYMKVSGTFQHSEVNDTHDALIGMAPLMTLAASGGDLTPLAESLAEHATGPELKPNDIMDLSVIIQLFGRGEIAMTLQEK